jgi:hypothetical protein
MIKTLIMEKIATPKSASIFARLGIRRLKKKRLEVNLKQFNVFVICHHLKTIYLISESSLNQLGRGRQSMYYGPH